MYHKSRKGAEPSCPKNGDRRPLLQKSGNPKPREGEGPSRKNEEGDEKVEEKKGQCTLRSGGRKS